MGQYNNLSVEAYTGTTPIVDPRNELVTAMGVEFATQYPGGIFADCSFSIPRNIADWWELQGATRIILRNDLRQVYEGYISNFQHAVDDTGQNTSVRCIGGWGHILMNWYINKCWVDDRVTDDAWVLQTSAGTVTLETEEWNIERQDRIHITPRAGQYLTGEYIGLRYTMPTGETIKRIYYDYNMAEKAGQAWEMSMYRSTDGTTFNQMGTAETYTLGSTTVHTATGVGTVDVALATASQYAEMRFYARATNNPVNDDHNHGVWNNVQVYSELGNINLSEISKDVIGSVTDINSTTEFVFSPVSALSLIPFRTNGYETAADIINKVTNQGDGAYNRWSAYLIPSEERAYTPNGKPQLVVQSYVVATDYDYVIGLRDDNLVMPFSISQDFDNIANWIVVVYQDLAGVVRYRSPDDNVNLKDTTSITDYGRRGKIVSVPGTSTSAIADSIGRQHLSFYKDPQYRLISPIVVWGYILGKYGNIIPASTIQSRYRIKLEDVLPDVTGTNQGLTFVITGTRYDDDSEMCAITTGVPDAPLLISYKAPIAPWSEDVTPAGGGGGGGGGDRTISDAQLRKWGMTRQQWWAIKATARGKALRASLKKKKKKG